MAMHARLHLCSDRPVVRACVRVHALSLDITWKCGWELRGANVARRPAELYREESFTGEEKISRRKEDNVQPVEATSEERGDRVHRPSTY